MAGLQLLLFLSSPNRVMGRGGGGGGCKIIPSPATSGRYVFTKHTAGNNRRSVRSGRT